MQHDVVEACEEKFGYNFDKTLEVRACMCVCVCVCMCHLFFAGMVAEYDVPARLLENKNSLFAKLVTEYTMRSMNGATSLNLPSDEQEETQEEVVEEVVSTNGILH